MWCVHVYDVFGLRVSGMFGVCVVHNVCCVCGMWVVHCMSVVCVLYGVCCVCCVCVICA